MSDIDRGTDRAGRRNNGSCPHRRSTKSGCSWSGRRRRPRSDAQSHPAKFEHPRSSARWDSSGQLRAPSLRPPTGPAGARQRSPTGVPAAVAWCGRSSRHPRSQCAVAVVYFNDTHTAEPYTTLLDLTPRWSLSRIPHRIAARAHPVAVRPGRPLSDRSPSRLRPPGPG